MENFLYSDIIGLTHDDTKKTMTQVKLNCSDHGTVQMPGGGLYQMENTLAGDYGDMDINTAMMDFMSISDSRDVGEQQIELPNYMRDMVSNVLTQQQDFPLEFSDSLQTDLDLGAATLWPDEDPLNLDAINPDDLFANTTGEQHQPENLYEHVAYQPLEYAASPQPQSTRAPASKRKVKTRSRDQRSAPEPQTSNYSVFEQPSLEELGVQVHSPYSDAGSSTDEGSRPRQRRPRVSYDTLTEEQKYQRIRELNNEASRLYRQRHRQSLSKLEKEQQAQEERNRVLRAKMEGLEKLRDEVQTYVNNVFKQRFSN
ncbi:cyclic AMP-dependent transcription factor ATF-5-like [Penaeus monodon]|uniref:cyclic AMP-dependent transcription factor ATF-5-like n=1 Tax=Penaeus monodon TaxID=6687 RepID=UPI0018A71025|nr:cyclic AMP-dependent transcription factor ATF-5-like [Penaeus monodon]